MKSDVEMKKYDNNHVARPSYIKKIIERYQRNIKGLDRVLTGAAYRGEFGEFYEGSWRRDYREVLEKRNKLAEMFNDLSTFLDERCLKLKIRKLEDYKKEADVHEPITVPSWTMLKSTHLFDKV